MAAIVEQLINGRLRRDCPRLIEQAFAYSGLATNVEDRIAAHNAGMSSHTASGRPWKFVAAVELATEERAVDFERYLKSGSGRAYAKRHFR